MILLALSQLAFADTITLDTGATILGDLARYELDGDCQISVTEGEYTGVIVIVPCSRVESFTRSPRAPAVALAEVELAPVVEVELVPPAPPAPGMPDSVAALKDDDFLHAFPPASGWQEAEESEPEELEPAPAETSDAASAPAPAPMESVPRTVPEMPPVGERPLSF